MVEKLEECPQCHKPLSQGGYDMQRCPCGWDAMRRADLKTAPLYVEDPRLAVAVAALRVIATMPGYSPDAPNFRVIAQTALKEVGR